MLDSLQRHTTMAASVTALPIASSTRRVLMYGSPSYRAMSREGVLSSRPTMNAYAPRCVSRLCSSLSLDDPPCVLFDMIKRLEPSVGGKSNVMMQRAGTGLASAAAPERCLVFRQQTMAIGASQSAHIAP
jgi:hypothetical protein